LFGDVQQPEPAAGCATDCHRLHGRGVGNADCFVTVPGKGEQRMLTDFAWLLPTQIVVSSDGFSVRVSAVIHLRMAASTGTIDQATGYLDAIGQSAQVVLRSLLGRQTLARILVSREALGAALQETLDACSDTCAIRISQVELKQIEPVGGLRGCSRKKKTGQRSPRRVTD
jgi:regulator of protease activity HflC (stomatin/prohibitin superfamily)